MVPQLLRISQFLCYRQPVEIDFRGMHVACLCGENGAGKSALLDAITWALWGKARANDQDLISLGGTEIRVELTFLLNGREYRVIRRRSASSGGSAKGLLELQARDGDHWHVLTEGGMRATQERINQLLGIDYETFVNSAFLLQGRADAFTRKTPAERKQVLADILNLQVYDLCQRYAREQAQDVKAQIAEGEREAARLRPVVEQIPTLEDEVACQRMVIQQAEERRRTLQQEYDALAQGVRALEQLAAIATERQERLKHLDATESALQKRQAERTQRLAAAYEVLTQADTIMHQYQALQEARERLHAVNEVLRQRQELLLQKQRLQTLLEQEIACVERELHAVERQLEQCSAEVQNLPDVQREVECLEAQLKASDGLEEQRDALERDIQEIQGRIGELQGLCKQLKEQGQQLRRQLDQLASIEAICPVCLRPLDDAHRAQLYQEIDQRGQELNTLYRTKQAEITALQKQLAELEQQRQDLRQRFRERQQIQQKLFQRQERFQLLLRQQEQQAILSERAATLRQQLQSGTLGQEYRLALQQLQAEIDRYPYDPQAHRDLQERVAALADAEARYHDLLQKQATVEQDERELQEITAQLQALRQEREAITCELEQIRKQVEGLELLRSRMALLARDLDDLDQQLRENHARLGATEQRLANAREAAQQLLVLERAQKQLRDELEILETLTRAFGRDGIQAMIIEGILPELEERANDILDRMPGNTMRLSFRTQRQKRTDGQLAETLDIIISDELGQRPYELYSGGEAFRLNFAIRVALSMLLAHRAGTRLETLVIDEGFGTQDAKGREGIVQAIRAVEDEFALILVITHLDELKDQFPTRITVVKTVDGSQVYVNA